GYTRECKTGRREDDVAIFSPTGAMTADPQDPKLAQSHDGAAHGCHLLHLAVGEKPDPLAVGRKKRVGPVLGSGERRGFRLVQEPGGQYLFAVRATRGKNH